MEDIIIFRRKTCNSIQKNAENVFKMQLPKGCFIFYDSIINTLELEENGAVMFAFDNKNKKAYIYKEEPQLDSYLLGKKEKTYMRFTSKQLMIFIEEFFDVSDLTVSLFKLTGNAINDNWNEFIYIKQ